MLSSNLSVYFFNSKFLNQIIIIGSRTS